MAIVRILKKHGGKLAFLALLLSGTAYIFASKPKYVGYKPDQPIPFSHKIHAGELKMECRFCHTGVEKGAHALVPDSATCIKCHQQVAPDSKHIQFLRRSYELGQPVRWRKVHDLPDHVRFSHKPHVARGIACQECHGPVETMEKVEVVAPFNMGWCVNCHREKTAELNLQDHPPGNNVSVELTDCGVCHY